jgi:hypothetical protein
MASHREIKEGSTGWVVRISGEDVPVKVIEKVRKSSGRGFEFKLKRIGSDGKPFGRTLTRGSGAIRREGTPAREAPAGFGRNGSSPRAKKKAPRKAKPKPKTRKKREKASAPPAPAAPPPPRPLSPFESAPSRISVDTGEERAATSPTSQLSSLRGQRRRKSASASPPSPKKRKPRKPKPEYPSPLVEKIVKQLMKSRGSIDEVKRITADAIAKEQVELWRVY